MKLYVTDGSPYARIARIVVLERGLKDRVEIVHAQTRAPGSPYYAINPSGRVPYLVRDDGAGMEGSALICAYLDAIDGDPAFSLPEGDAGWEARRLESLAISLLDGLAVWLREARRPSHEQSPEVVAHERARSERMLDAWENEIEHAWMRGPLHMAHITLGCALGLDARIPELRWRPGHPRLAAWLDRIAARPSFAATAPQVSTS